MINVCDGNRLGFVEDVLVEPVRQDSSDNCSGPCKYMGFFGREHDFVIPWDCIVKVGEDTILVELKSSTGRYGKIRECWV